MLILSHLIYCTILFLHTITAFLMLERNELSSSLPLTPDRFSISSYVIPQAGLVVAPRPNGNYYQVDFQVCPQVVYSSSHIPSAFVHNYALQNECIHILACTS